MMATTAALLLERRKNNSQLLPILNGRQWRLILADFLGTIMAKTEWGVTIGVKRIPNPKIKIAQKTVMIDGQSVLPFAWVIERHGIVVYSNTAQQCRAKFAKAYMDETGTELPL